MKTYNLTNISEKFDFYRVLNRSSDSEIIQKIKEVKNELNSSDPVWFREQKNGNTVTTYNIAGVIVSTSHLATEVEGLKPVKTHRQFVFGGEDHRKMIEKLTIELCRRRGLKVFNNGNLYAESKIKIKEILANG